MKAIIFSKCGIAFVKYSDIRNPAWIRKISPEVSFSINNYEVHHRDKFIVL